MAPRQNDSAHTPVVIIGAGFSGLAMACQLKQQLDFHDFVIYDRAPELGGTWYANRYPGCGVDIPAAFYSLSFAPNPHFSRFFPKQQEILEYINDVADKFNVTEHFVGSTEWVGADWQDDSCRWSLSLRETSTGRVFTHQCEILISAVGGLSNPNRLSLLGHDRFKGDIVHTAEWDPDISIEQRNVVVIGNGSSSTQLVPTIAEKAKSVTQFIRTPQYYVPSQNSPISKYWRNAFHGIPGVLKLFRALVFLYLESSVLQFGRTWLGSKMRNRASTECRRYIRECAPEEYWSLLFPNYELGCKRRVFDNDGYVATLHRANVHVVDDPIVSLLEQSALTKSGKVYPADVIVLATGFSPTQHDVDLHGRRGYSRKEHWKRAGAMQAFNTVAMSGFPNFFYLLGPNSGRGHTSTVYTAEVYVNLVIRLIEPILSRQASSVEVKRSSEENFNRQLRAGLEKTILENACRSWYIDPTTEKNWFIYPWSSIKMWLSARSDITEDWIYQVSAQPPIAPIPCLMARLTGAPSASSNRFVSPERA
ncbi:flavin-containing monooxygenase [Aspergillus candidus]|uniref:FAD/NAD(P)-binding domain-containing protein n=1 Tax=Aspergillus candidus TaxID=41067 RepID=A0A2I2FGM8_ASPCN|nr:FAD/NAD(P)-binding domain-containing protein [Aspergillus candidus]PLB39788.1 FAD/NAD(P)-binding domain-containing protein [Aspergillus candidus]